MKASIILTGSTGMVGEGVLHECLSNPSIEEILLVNRRPGGFQDPKIKEIIHPDFLDPAPLEGVLGGFDACFFCLGVSSVGIDKETYYRQTYTLTLNFASLLSRLNPSMVFCYISGAGTDSTEKGRSSWARVKGKTENDLAKLPFRKVYNFRPGILEPTRGLKNTLAFYKYLGWLIPLVRLIAPNSITTLKELGKAMINATVLDYERQILEVPDIKALAKAKRLADN